MGCIFYVAVWRRRLEKDGHYSLILGVFTTFCLNSGFEVRARVGITDYPYRINVRFGSKAHNVLNPTLSKV